MQNGPYGITSKPSIFKTAYGNILSVHLALDSLDKSNTIPQELGSSIKGKIAVK
jgi:hypothetical protein